MRGYISFLLVLASVLLVILLLNSSILVRELSFSDAIISEKTYQLQMNVKELILESARQGAINGFNGYSHTHSKIACKRHPLYTNNPDCFNDHDAILRTKTSAIASMAQLNTHNSDFDLLLWCTQSKNEHLAQKHSIKLIEKRTLSNQENSFLLSSALCNDILSIKLKQSKIPYKNPTLEKLIFGETGTIIGISIYSSKFRVASLSYVPLGIQVKT